MFARAAQLGRYRFGVHGLTWHGRLVNESSMSEGTGNLAGLGTPFVRGMASQKAGGSSGNGRDRWAKGMGVKEFGSEWVIPGNIIVRQHGARWHPGDFVGMGRDYTLFSLTSGQVKFEALNGLKRRVSVIPAALPSKTRRVDSVRGIFFGDLFRLRRASRRDREKSRGETNPFSGHKEMFKTSLQQRWRKSAPRLY